MRRAAFSAALGVAALGAAQAASPSDYVADSSTTYCKAAQAATTAVLKGLSPSSTEACPVAISMSVTVDSYVTFSTTDFDVAWNVSANGNWSSQTFPVEALNGALTVANASVIACRVDTDCSKKADLLYPLESHDVRDLPQLTVAAQTVSPLTSYRFRLPATGDYFIIGDVSLPSTDAGVVQNYVFQRVRTSSDLAFMPGKVVAGPATEDGTQNRAASSTRSTSTPAPSDDQETDASEKKEQVTAASASNSKTSIEFGIIAAVGLVAVVAMVAVARQRHRAWTNSQASSGDFTKSALDNGSVVTEPVAPVYHSRPPASRQPIRRSASMGWSAPSQPIKFGAFARSSSMSDTSSTASNKGYNANPSGL